MNRSINVIATVGLALGGVLGMAGALVTQQNVQSMLWAIDGAGLVMATSMLVMKYFRAGNDVVAGGFWFLRSAKALSCFPRRLAALRAVLRPLPLAPRFGGRLSS